jgi:hypothetical protein
MKLENIIWFCKDSEYTMIDCNDRNFLIHKDNNYIKELHKEFENKKIELIKIEMNKAIYNDNCIKRYYNSSIITNVITNCYGKCSIQYNIQYTNKNITFDTFMSYEEFMNKFSHLLPFIRGRI